MKLQKLNYGSKYCGHQSSISHLLVESIGIKIMCLFFTPSLWGRGTGIVVFLFIWLSIEWQAWRGRWCGVFLHFRGDIDRMRWYGDTFTPSKLHLIWHDFFAFQQKQQQRNILCWKKVLLRIVSVVRFVITVYFSCSMLTLKKKSHVLTSNLMIKWSW